jgi:hypothetical protein
MESMSTYLRTTKELFPVFLVSYERLVKAPADVLGDLLHWLGMEHDGQMVQRAITNMQFKNLQAMEAQESKARRRADGQTLFFRRGYPGSGEAELQPATLQEIRERTAPLMEEANERLEKQASESPSARGNSKVPEANTANQTASGLSVPLRQT